ncbi:MAG: hypothetical protein Q8R37_00970 [Nanoarchaeota archaeon]|nr:hypothetical protein [Nanoarchaeota archaeon]
MTDNKINNNCHISMAFVFMTGFMVSNSPSIAKGKKEMPALEGQQE